MKDRRACAFLLGLKPRQLRRELRVIASIPTLRYRKVITAIGLEYLKEYAGLNRAVSGRSACVRTCSNSLSYAVRSAFLVSTRGVKQTRMETLAGVFMP